MLFQSYDEWNSQLLYNNWCDMVKRTKGTTIRKPVIRGINPRYRKCDLRAYNLMTDLLTPDYRSDPPDPYLSKQTLLEPISPVTKDDNLGS